jgi:hypothetical protein
LDDVNYLITNLDAENNAGLISRLENVQTVAQLTPSEPERTAPGRDACDIE